VGVGPLWKRQILSSNIVEPLTQTLGEVSGEVDMFGKTDVVVGVLRPMASSRIVAGSYTLGRESIT
jgi:hypothetical protein